MSTRRLALGRYGEEVAARYLEQSGLRVLDRNWRCAAGEIDIVASEGDLLIVCEVKTRSSTAFGQAVEAVTPRKVRRLRVLAYHWLLDHQVHAPRIRFDVVGVLQAAAGPPQIVHLRGVE